MSTNVFSKLFYHITWATKRRAPILADPLREVALKAVRDKSKDLGCFLHAANGVEDHVHVVVEIKPSIAISEVVGQLKGYSAHMVNALSGNGMKWQEGYGVVSFRETELAKVVRYVDQQAVRHSSGKVSELLEFVGSNPEDEDQSP